MNNRKMDLYDGYGDYERRLSKAQEYVKILHGSNKGLVQLIHIENGQVKFKHSYKGNEVGNKLASPSEYQWLDKNDVYISLNVFSRYGRRTDEDLLGFNALYTDLDFYKEPFNKTKEQARKEIDDLIEKKIILPPSLIVDSGRGIQLIWLMDFMKNTPAFKKLWNFMQKTLAERFSDLNADPAARSTTQVYRLVGTHSNRNGSEIDFEHLADRYSVTELKTMLFSNTKATQAKPLVKKTKVQKSNKKKIIKNLNTYTLARSRKEDLELLVDLRKGNVCRKRTIFYYAVFAIEVFFGDEKLLMESLNHLNARFFKRLPKGRLEGAYKSAIKSYSKKRNEEGKYFFKNETLIEALEITDEEQMLMKQLIGKEEKQRRDTLAKRKKRREQGKMTTKEYNEKRNNKKLEDIKAIKEMLKVDPKIKNDIIAKRLGLGKSRIKQLKKEAKNELQA